MASYIELLIPLGIGILGITSAHLLVKPDAVDFKKKTSTIRNCGWLLVGVSIILGLVEFFSH